MTGLVLAFSRAFDLDLSRIHNDSTTVKAYAAYPEKTASGFKLKKGHSKDHIDVWMMDGCFPLRYLRHWCWAKAHGKSISTI